MYLLNDLSLNGQFDDIPSFRRAVEKIMSIRQEIERYGRTLYCGRNLLHCQVTSQLTMQNAVNSLPASNRSALMSWLTRHGPFWEEARRHDSAQWLDTNDELISDTALGEAAFCIANGLKREVVSFDPSSWRFSPIQVRWVQDEQSTTTVAVTNHWLISSVSESLAGNRDPISTWDELAEQIPAACSRLTFASNAFASLRGHPFSPGAAERIQVILATLDKFCGCFDSEGRRTAEGHRLYNEHFTGEKSWFSDSSDSEKSFFRKELTFPCPDAPDKQLFCSWHGKIKTPQLRIHFSWPIRVNSPVYVVYIGPKRTIRG